MIFFISYRYPYSLNIYFMSLLHARHCAKGKNWLGFILCPATYIVGYLIIESPIIFKKFLSHLFSRFFPFLTLSYAFKFFPKKITSDSFLHPWYCTWILFSCYQIHKTFAFGHRPLSWCSSRTSWTFYGSILDSLSTLRHSPWTRFSVLPNRDFSVYYETFTLYNSQAVSTLSPLFQMFHEMKLHVTKGKTAFIAKFQVLPTSQSLYQVPRAALALLLYVEK